MKKFARNWWNNEWHEKWKKLGLHVESTPRQINVGRTVMYGLIGIIGIQWWSYNKVWEEFYGSYDVTPKQTPDVKPVGEHIKNLMNEWRESIPHHVGAFGLASAQEHFGIESVDNYFRDRQVNDEIIAHVTAKGYDAAVDYYSKEWVDKAILGTDYEIYKEQP